MSDLWGYAPRKCENDFCPMNCDRCRKADYGTMDDLFESVGFFGTDEQKQKILTVAKDSRFSDDDLAMAIWMCSSAEYEDICAEVEFLW